MKQVASHGVALAVLANLKPLFSQWAACDHTEETIANSSTPIMNAECR